MAGCNLKKAKSCGCKMYEREAEDLSNQRFGILTAIRRSKNNTLPSGQQQTIWECKCDCGSVVYVRAATLKNGDTRSCGCIKSHGERLVSEALVRNHIEYIKEYTFADCRNQKGNRVKFDFALFKEHKLIGLIEYQGEQHFSPPKRTPWFGQLQREETDQLKRDYCLTHNIPLFEIRYDENVENRVANIINMLHDNTVPSREQSRKV